MAKEIKVEPKNGETRRVPWLKEPDLQSATHTTFADLGEKILVTQGKLIDKSEDGKEITIELPFADKTITYYCQRVYLGDKKK